MRFQVDGQFAGRRGLCPNPECQQTYTVPLRDQVSSHTPSRVSSNSAENPSAGPRRQRARTTRTVRPVRMAGMAMIAVVGAGLLWQSPSGDPLSSATAAKPSSQTSQTAGDNAEKTPRRVASDDAFENVVAPFVKQYCTDCHGDYEPSAGVPLHELDSPDAILKNEHNWETALKMLRIDGMPPADHEPRPTDAEREAVVEWLDSKLHYVDCDVVDDAGRVTIRRLNRTEYNNTIRDLLGVDINPAANFPSDDVGNGFDNMGDVLSLPPLLLERYVEAAEKVAAAVVVTTPLSEQKFRFTGADLQSSGGASRDNQDGYVLHSTGSVFRNFDVQVAGAYILRVDASADQAGEELAKVEFRVDGKPIKVHEVRGHREVRTYEVRHTLSRGPHKIEAAFINDYYNPRAERSRDRDRNLAIRMLELQGPLDAELPEPHRELVIATPANEKSKKSAQAAAREIFERLLPRAYRRPVDETEVDRILSLVTFALEQGESFERAVQIGLQGVLVSPHFLFRVEYDAQPNDASAQHAISEYELASRLSYFLWSSMPDRELFDLAAAGTLSQPEVLDQQVDRMLADPKADALVNNFAMQWLNLGLLDELTPDPNRFPQFTPQLRRDMVEETRLFVREVFRQDRSVLDFLDADFTFVNERLAEHYGIADVKGEAFQRVALPADQRAGVLTHASILTLTSNPTRTSLVKRGKWILDNVLGVELPPTPANVPALEESAKDVSSASLRDQLRIHRENPGCASCHDVLDPLGFGFETFDAIGRWREKDGGHPVDASGTLPSGETFRGPVELVQILKTRDEDFCRLLTTKLLTYALGRGLERYDRCTVDEIVEALEANGYRFSVLVKGIVNSKPFLMRRGDAGVEPGAES